MFTRNFTAALLIGLSSLAQANEMPDFKSINQTLPTYLQQAKCMKAYTKEVNAMVGDPIQVKLYVNLLGNGLYTPCQALRILELSRE